MGAEERGGVEAKKEDVERKKKEAGVVVEAKAAVLAKMVVPVVEVPEVEVVKKVGVVIKSLKKGS